MAAERRVPGEALKSSMRTLDHHSEIAVGFLGRIFGPKSKYDKRLPYTYEARIRIFAESDEYKSYFSDTVCGLIEYLHRHGIAPDGVSIFEIYAEREAPIDCRLFATAERSWRFKPEICIAFEQHYPGHIRGNTCSFQDRERAAIGP